MHTRALDYRGKRILAPMVRVGTLPMRMLAAEYGADIVYTEEMIDKRLIAATRVDNAELGTVDFLDKGGSLVFRTTPLEKHRLVAQLGTADPELAVAAALAIAPYVSAVDVNMGCPVHFSTSGGMGSALLAAPDRAVAILTALVRALPCPVTCKIRLLATEEETAALAQRLAATGIAALGVHGRFVSQKPREGAHWARIASLVAALPPSLPVIANGDVFAFEDFARLRDATGAAAAMCARGAQWNASIFRAQGLLPGREVRAAYAAACVAWDNPLSNSKYCLREMLGEEPRGLQTPEAVAIHAAKTPAALAQVYGIDAATAPQMRAQAGEREAARAAAALRQRAAAGEVDAAAPQEEAAPAAAQPPRDGSRKRGAEGECAPDKDNE